MKQDIADRWIAALLSGQFEQGQYLLHNGNQFCCLGVLCKLYADETGIQGVRFPGSEIIQYHYLTEVLPIEIMRWAGMQSSTGSFGSDSVSSLANLNDGGTTFARIAEVIKQRVEEL